MSITVRCDQCGKTSDVPDQWAGRRGRCKGCGAVISVPPAVQAETSIRVETATYDPPAIRPEILPAVQSPPPVPVQSAPPTGHLVYATREPSAVACPFCAEPIQPAAKKCKHCGEYLDPVMRKANEAKAPTIVHAPASPPPPIAIHNTTITQVKSVATAVVRGGGKKGMGCCGLIFFGTIFGLIAVAMLSPKSPKAQPQPQINAAPPKPSEPPNPLEPPKADNRPVIDDAAKEAAAEPAPPGETIEERAKRERARTLEIRKARRGH